MYNIPTAYNMLARLFLLVCFMQSVDSCLKFKKVGCFKNVRTYTMHDPTYNHTRNPAQLQGYLDRFACSCAVKAKLFLADGFAISNFSDCRLLWGNYRGEIRVNSIDSTKNERCLDHNLDNCNVDDKKSICTGNENNVMFVYKFMDGWRKVRVVEEANYSGWSEWGTCTESCEQYRERTCMRGGERVDESYCWHKGFWYQSQPCEDGDCHMGGSRYKWNHCTVVHDFEDIHEALSLREQKQPFCEIPIEEHLEEAFEYTTSASVLGFIPEEGEGEASVNKVGFMYNIDPEEEDTYQYVYLHLNDPHFCASYGLIVKGVDQLKDKVVKLCRSRNYFNEEWYHLKLVVGEEGAEFLVNDIDVVDSKLPAVREITGRAGIILANGQMTKVQFKNLKMYY